MAHGDRIFSLRGGNLRGGGLDNGRLPCAVCRGSAHLRKAGQEMSAQLSEEAMAAAPKLNPNPTNGVVEMAEQGIRDLEERLSRQILDLWRR